MKRRRRGEALKRLKGGPPASTSRACDPSSTMRSDLNAMWPTGTSKRLQLRPGPIWLRTSFRLTSIASVGALAPTSHLADAIRSAAPSDIHSKLGASTVIAATDARAATAKAASGNAVHRTPLDVSTFL